MTTVTARSTPPAPSAPRRFGFRITAPARAVLLPFGVGVKPAEVIVADDGVTVRFGFFGTHVALSDIERFEISGPFWWLRAIAVRHTAFKTDISYCTDGRGAVRLYLKSPRRIHFARHVDQVYLGVEDLEGLAAELRSRGIPGEDKRRSRAPAGA
jgi:hypothetical protein